MAFELQNQNQVSPLIESKVKEDNHIFISGLDLLWVRFKMQLNILKLIIRSYTNPKDWMGALHYIIKLRRQFLGHHSVQKMVKSNGKYYLELYTPGWPGPVFNEFITSQLQDYKPIVTKKVNRFSSTILAITKKCALQCEHCFEWDELNKQDALTKNDLQQIVEIIQEKGVSQLFISGGEPLLKMDYIEAILQGAKPVSDFWIYTSGFKLTDVNAKRLKHLGVTGVVISLDHYLPEKHNKFRQFKDAYFWVEQAILNAQNHGLLTALSVCVIRELADENHLFRYLEHAKNLKIPFVQLLEPKAVGHYSKKDVLLQQEHIKTLEHVFETINFNPEYRNYPILTYHGYYQRRMGCLSAGNKSIYIDTNGNLNSCPFCHNTSGNVLAPDFEEHLNALKIKGCSSYPL